MNVHEAIQVLSEELKNNSEFYENVKLQIANGILMEYASHSINEPEGFVYCPTSEDLNEIADSAAENILESIFII